jgi:hypothetical protein
MLSGHADQADGFPHMHYRKHSSVAGALHRVGFRLGMAEGPWW